VNYFLYLYHELPADRRASKKSQASKIKLIIRVTENAMPKKKKKEGKKKNTRRAETPSCQRKEGTTRRSDQVGRFMEKSPRLINIISHPPLGPVGSRSSKSRTPPKRPSHSKVSLIPLLKLLLVLQTKLIDLAAKTIR
jgi:hypothetical protein